KNSGIFDAAELETLQTSVAAMQNNIQLKYRDSIDALHNGFPAVVYSVPTGGCGHP
ncbi:hypothetical protein B0H10DRAFT_1813491, partial [Mycena sp. CBHHK59/15]